MQPILRTSMAWLHTWTGVVFGSLLFTIFWMGTLSVFDREIDQWMMPATRLPTLTGPAVKLDGLITEQAQRLALGSPQWFIRLPSERVPAVELRWRNEARKTLERRYLHPQTGTLLEHTDTLAGSGFIFPFHYSLHLKWNDLGHWLVGLAAMAMLLLLSSGVIMHRKIFADFFLFRPRQRLPRASLDLHTLTGVLALPFHLMIPLSGLIILFSIYFPSALMGAYGDVPTAAKQARQEQFGQFQRPQTGQPGTLVSLDGLVRQAEQQWPGGQAGFLRVWHPGDANSFVEVRRSHAREVTMNLDAVYFDAQTGALLHRFEAAPVMRVQRFVSGLHFIQFEHWTLRWLYFLAGLSGCVMIGTGF
ncbi:MAG: PepSY-associated TM helix domain-containing protein, partial [Polaromonas sp.]